MRRVQGSCTYYGANTWYLCLHRPYTWRTLAGCWCSTDRNLDPADALLTMHNSWNEGNKTRLSVHTRRQEGARESWGDQGQVLLIGVAAMCPYIQIYIYLLTSTWKRAFQLFRKNPTKKYWILVYGGFLFVTAVSSSAWRTVYYSDTQAHCEYQVYRATVPV